MGNISCDMKIINYFILGTCNLLECCVSLCQSGVCIFLYSTFVFIITIFSTPPFFHLEVPNFFFLQYSIFITIVCCFDSTWIVTWSWRPDQPSRSITFQKATVDTSSLVGSVIEPTNRILGDISNGWFNQYYSYGPL